MRTNGSSSVRRGFHVTERGYDSTCSEAAPKSAVKLGGNTVYSSQANLTVFIFTFFSERGKKIMKKENKTMKNTNIPYKIYLSENEMPKQW